MLLRSKGIKGCCNDNGMLRHESYNLNKKNKNETTKLKQEHVQKMKELQDDMELKITHAK